MTSPPATRSEQYRKSSRKVSLLVVVAALVIGLFALPGTASAKEEKDARGSKVDLCHADANGHRLISISANAIDGHTKNHDDGLVGDPIPSMDGYNFGQDCEPVPACTPATVYGTPRARRGTVGYELRSADGAIAASTPMYYPYYYDQPFQMQVPAELLPGTFTIGFVRRNGQFVARSTLALECGQIYAIGAFI